MRQPKRKFQEWARGGRRKKSRPPEEFLSLARFFFGEDFSGEDFISEIFLSEIILVGIL